MSISGSTLTNSPGRLRLAVAQQGLPDFLEAFRTAAEYRKPLEDLEEQGLVIKRPPAKMAAVAMIEFNPPQNNAINTYLAPLAVRDAVYGPEGSQLFVASFENPDSIHKNRIGVVAFMSSGLKICDSGLVTSCLVRAVTTETIHQCHDEGWLGGLQKIKGLW